MLQVSPTTVGNVCAEVSRLDTSECGHGRTGQGARNDLADGDSSRSRKPDSPELLQRHEHIDETVGQLRDQGMLQKEIATATGLPFNQVQDSYQRLEGEHRAKRKAPAAAAGSPPTAPPQPEPQDVDNGVLDQMVTLFLRLTAKTKRRLVTQLLREMSEEDRAEVFSEVGR